MAHAIPQAETKRKTPKRVRSDQSVNEFLERFAAALTAGDGHAAAAMWSLPAFVMGDEVVHAINDPADVEAFYAGAKDQYNSRGITSTRPEIMRLDWATERIAIVHVRWPHLNAAGDELGAESSTYVLRVDETGALKLRVAVMRGVSG